MKLIHWAPLTQGEDAVPYHQLRLGASTLLPIAVIVDVVNTAVTYVDAVPLTVVVTVLELA